MKAFTVCTSFVLCLVLLAVILLQPTATVKAINLMEGITPNSAEGTVPDARFINAQTDFTLRLFKACASDENTLVSPLSVMLALAMTANGADGQTKAEMEALLGMPIDDLNRYLYSYANQLSTSEKAKVAIANSIWYRDDPTLTVNKPFLQTNADYYGASAYKAPFDDSTVSDINNWTKEKTDGMIDKIIDQISSDTMLYLINALVFDAKWERPYKDTTQVYEGHTFTANDGTEQKVTMMHQTEHKYLSDSLATGFMKPYAGGNYAFAALLPNEGVSIEEYVASLTAEGLQKTLNSAQNASVFASIPQFRYDYDIELKDVLMEMGMPTAFDGARADFTPMGTCDRGNLYIGSVLHKTHITVDTQGTRAAAVTKVEMKAEGAYSPKYEVTLDRPFVYLILDMETNLPLFIGTVLSIEQ
ncbi:MAG: serpin family protein [Oscillospiraceae bacterium]|nr:serpin family protein [Oscillospiraceae bacterium]